MQLNLAAMLDMAFQLLTFFILTFRPPPAEVQINLRLPPPQAIKTVKTNVQAGSDTTRTDPVSGIETLIIGAYADPKGDLVGLQVGDQPLNGLGALEGKLQQVFSDPSNPFEQIIVQVGSDLRYAELAKVIDVCVRQKFADGTPVTKMSFVELPSPQ